MRHLGTPGLFLAFAIALSFAAFSAEPVAVQNSETNITHCFLALGADTVIYSNDSKIVWQYPHGTRDGWVLPNGNLLLSVSKCKEYPSGAIVEINRDNKVLFEFKGTQSEVNVVQLLPNGNFLMDECGTKPRMMEVTRDGKIALEFPLQCQNKNFHMETRMGRKLSNGNYLVPHLLDHAVREYNSEGKVVWEARTPETPPECWPFTAIRLENGNTLVDCTHSKMSVEFDAAGKIVWQLTNADLPSPLLSDPCGCQRLPNGNTVICSYGAGGANDVKLLEVTPDKKVVWTFKSGKAHGIHEIQVLETNGKPIEGMPLK